MHTIVNRKFSVRPVVAALALALSAVNAHAVPTPNQMPGYGLILGVGPATVTITSPGGQYTVTGGGGVGGQVYNFDVSKPGPALLLDNSAGLQAYGVVRWGPFGGSLETVNPAGFNVGSGATMVITSKTGIIRAALLNIDTSGNQSQIYGSLVGDNSGGGVAPAIFVANGNGIIVGGSGKISSPTGVGLIGATMLANPTDVTSTAVYDFTGYHFGGDSLLDVFANVSGQPQWKTAVVDVRGSINGDALANLPAKYVLLAGSDVTNTGNVFGTDVYVYAGMVPQHGFVDTINGVNATPVQRLFDVTLSVPMATDGTSSGPCSTCVEVDLQNAGSVFRNLTGSVSSKLGSINIEAAHGIQNGINGDPIQFIGLFADSDIYTDVYDPLGVTGLYNVVAGYSTGFLLKSLNVNTRIGSDGDVTLNALTRASEPSSITTKGGGVTINGANVYIDSTINHKSPGYNDGYDLNITASNLVEINAAVGAGNNVYITSNGAGGVKIAATVDSNRDSSADQNGQVTILSNYPGAPITITAAVNDHGHAGFIQDATVRGDGPISISGTLTSEFGDVYVTNTGGGMQTDILTTVTAYSDVTFDMQGPLRITNAVTALNGNIKITGYDSASATTLTGTLFATFGNVDVNVEGPLEFTDTSSVHGGGHVDIANHGVGSPTTLAGLIVTDNNEVMVDVIGPLLISNTITAANGARITNSSLMSGTSTTITGPGVFGGNGDVEVHNNGSAFVTHLDVSGDLQSQADVKVSTTGNLALDYTAAGDRVDISVGGLASALNGLILSGNVVNYTANFATTKVKPAAEFHSPTVYLNVLNFTGVNESGMSYADIGEKPFAQIYTDNLKVKALGSVNAPIAGNTYWPDNAMWVAPNGLLMMLLPPPVATTVNATISAVGSGFQAINLGFHSDLLVDSGNTRAPFDSIGLTTGGFPAGTPAGNAGSSLILQSDGAMTILGNGSTFFPLVSPPDSFIFPGGAVFISQTTLNQTVPVLTAYTTSAASWKGVFYEADTLNLFAYTQVNGNSWLNVNKLPSTGVPIAYSLVSLGLNAFGNVLTPSAVHLNAYTTVVGGGPVEFCPGIPPLCP